MTGRTGWLSTPPSSTPGWSSALILRDLVQEATACADEQDLPRPDFTFTTDDDSTVWEDET